MFCALIIKIPKFTIIPLKIKAPRVSKPNESTPKPKSNAYTNEIMQAIGKNIAQLSEIPDVSRYLIHLINCGQLIASHANAPRRLNVITTSESTGCDVPIFIIVSAV